MSSRILALALVLAPLTACAATQDDGGATGGQALSGTGDEAPVAAAFNPLDAAKLPTAPDVHLTGSATDPSMVDCASYRKTASYAFGAKLAVAVTTPAHVESNPKLYLSQVGATVAIAIGHYQAACGMAETNNRLGRENGWEFSCWPRRLSLQGLTKACPEPGEPHFFAGCRNCSTDPPKDQMDPRLGDTPEGK